MRPPETIQTLLNQPLESFGDPFPRITSGLGDPRDIHFRLGTLGWFRVRRRYGSAEIKIDP